VIEGFGCEEEAAERIGYSERVDIGTVTKAEPAFIVGAPDFIRRCWVEDRLNGDNPANALPGNNEPFSCKDVVDGRD
jgi:hypothetical protein